METTKMFVKAFCMLLFIFYPARGDFKIFPRNTAAVDGDTILLECQPDTGKVSEFSWRYVTDDETITGGTVVRPLFDGRAQLSYDETELVYNLDLNTTADGKLQQYSCGNYIFTHYSDLILLDTVPSCSVNADLTNLIEDESFTVECIANYKSEPNWNAELKCTDDVNDQDQSVKDSGTDGTMMKGSFTIVSNSNLQGHSYSCETSFPVPPIKGDARNKKYDTRAPTYIFSYQTDLLNVQYAAREMDISNIQEEYYPGDAVTCTAQGHPTVTYIWVEVQVDGDVPVTVLNVLEIKESMVGKNNMYRCEARNTIRNQDYTVNQTIEFTVSIPPTTTPPTTTDPVTTDSTATVPTVPPPSGLSGGAIAGIVIGVVLGLLLIFLLLLFLIIRSRRPAKKKEVKKPASSSIPQQYGGTLPPAYTPPTRKEDNDDLGMFVRDNTIGSRQPLPAEEPGAYINNSFGQDYI